MTVATPAARSGSGRPAIRRKPTGRETVAGYVFLSPWLLGLLGITAIPMLYSLYLSFTDFDLLSSPQWIGLANYQRMFTSDPQFWHAVRVTIVFAVTSVPLKLAAALAVALLLNRKRRGTGLFRALFYLPSLLGGSVALAIVWQAMFGGNGAFNGLLRIFGIPGEPWVNDPNTALGTLVLLAVWQFGAPMVIFLAGLKQIPAELYEAARVDGAGRFRQLLSITLPILSPVIFFNLVLETIHGFQGFTAAFVISNGTGGPTDSTMLYTLYLYLRGFGDFKMGYAAAMAWVFVLAVGLLTAVLFGTGRMWVHYSDAGER
ncbi:carbohydrate ABC transporter permease [Fodinicola feengrottensis]|uniref:Sugar ABC transporter permease n=1 Tax=Fodinicola feengrottensis TaxID=435914 RepID=A0ABN2I920_9ACTN|nr:sugar ABC transporter permease [Fodinicola feengrottensis]